MLKLTTIRLSSPLNKGCEIQPVVAGVPVASGRIFDAEVLSLATEAGQVIPSHFQITAKWPDQSIKWFLVFFQAPVHEAACQSFSVHISEGNSLVSECSGDTVNVRRDTSGSHLIVDTGAAEFHVGLSELALMKQVYVENQPKLGDGGARIVMKDEDGEDLSSSVESVSIGDEANSIQRTVTIAASFQHERSNKAVSGTFDISFFAGSEYVRLDCSLHNSGEAKHPKGRWDLGDQGSILFSACYLEITQSHDEHVDEAFVQVEQDGEWKRTDVGNCWLYQESSGGENWQSESHVNSRGIVPIRHRGYRLLEDGKETSCGLRADPILWLGRETKNVIVYLREFWQNFPKAIEVKPRVARLHLFPECFPDTFELQGGEQKTHTVDLHFGGDGNALQWCRHPVNVELDVDYFARTRVLSFFPTEYVFDDLQQLIHAGLNGNRSFYIKREIADEYGWRNFGDVYADHEALNYTGKTPLVSHYNNQYDVLDGFVRQYLMTGNREWLDLAVPLARHVVDIDTYKTTSDRDEYNNGLFWHTDHYLSAHTCTHRTWSAKNDFSHDGEVGGGPGSEHCYTTGLTNFYFLTGDVKYKDAVLQLVEWVTRSMDGSNTVVEKVYRFLRNDLKKIGMLLRGHRVSKQAYPLTRATGNYLSSVLDAYNLTSNESYIRQAEKIIERTVHPNDTISLRGLDSIETGWSYLVFLQSLAKYIYIKSANDQQDESLQYARSCFLHYANWMVDHERPFLENIEQLEFPNLTWVSQDLRKAYIFQLAGEMAGANEDKFRERMQFFREYVVGRIKSDPSNQHTRVLALLMQNYLPDNYVDGSVFKPNSTADQPSIYEDEPVYSIFEFLGHSISEFWQALKGSSIRGEIRWIRHRIG